MKKILILGGNGMLGGAVLRYLSNFKDFEVACTIRSNNRFFSQNVRCYEGVELSRNHDFQFLRDYGPDVVINCIGDITKTNDYTCSTGQVFTNAMLPHILKDFAIEIGFRLIHFSTDCVFDGQKGGHYNEANKQAFDCYGQSKSLGEVSGENVLTIRTSIVGPEFDGKSKGLFEWFKSQTSDVKGYKSAIFSGMTTMETAKLIKFLLDEKVFPTGVWNVSGPVIDKFTLLNLFKIKLGANVNIIPDYSLQIDRSLCDDEFRERFKLCWKVDWSKMVNEMDNFNV